MKPESLLGTLVKAYEETEFTGDHAILNGQAWVERCERNVLAETTDGQLVPKPVPCWFLVTVLWPNVPESKLYKTEQGALAALEKYAADRQMVEVAL